MPRYFLGVDGGQSSTLALIGDESGRVVGVGEGGPSNHVGAEEGRARLVGAVSGALAAACEAAGLDAARQGFAAACLGFTAGPADKEAILHGLIRAERLSVTDDAVIAFAGALEGRPGVVTIAGTGSIAFGRGENGATARAGGWGYLFGDEGSAFDLTRQALRAALRQEEGWGPPTSLHARLPEAAGLPTIRDVQRRFYTADYPRHRIASFARVVTQAAAEGDEVARRILEHAAADLVRVADVVRHRLFGPAGHVIASYAGGVFDSPDLLAAFTADLEADGRTTVVAPRAGPAAGALIEAYRLAGAPTRLSGLPEGI
jgi:N-acetylglucosamine kinase